MSESQEPPQGSSANAAAVTQKVEHSIDGQGVVITSHFKMIWLTMTALTLCLAAADILLALLIKSPTGAQQQAMTMCDTFAGMGFGAIFGLISAKVLS